MASADLRKELECPICLDFYTNPVTLPCGHNYCQDCIGCMLDTQEWPGGYFCPECREQFQNRPSLQKNITLCKILETIQTTECSKDTTGFSCTQCYHTPVPAVKACLHCEAYLCVNHLSVHSKSPEHVLCDPTTSLESRKCSVHKKILEYYCINDSAYICVSCRLDGVHQGHQVRSLGKAAKKKKQKLRNVLPKLLAKREEAEKRVPILEERKRKLQEQAASETERFTALFRDLRRRLEDLEKKVMWELSGKAERITLYVSDSIRELEIKKDDLSEKMRQIEELCNMTDPLAVLEGSETDDLYDIDVRIDKEAQNKIIYDEGDLDVAGVLHTLHTGLSDIMSLVNVQKCPGTRVHPHSSKKSKGHTTAEASRPNIQPPSTIQRPQCQAGGPNAEVVEQTLRFTDILLNLNTAGNHLIISEDRRSASWADCSQRLPEPPERFFHPQALSSQSFSSGRHYWEVDVEGSMDWTVGVCYPSIDRSGARSLIGENEKSWSLDLRCFTNYLMRHDKKDVLLPGKVSNRIRIVVDYEAGQISFYDLGDPIQHLHTFTTTFTEPLHAGICVWDGCVKVCKESKM